MLDLNLSLDYAQFNRAVYSHEYGKQLKLTLNITLNLRWK